jgi:hypothetical protein
MQTTKRQLNDARRKVEVYKNKYYGLIINQVDRAQYKKYIKDYDYFEEENMSKRYVQNIKKKIKRIKSEAYEKEKFTIY